MKKILFFLVFSLLCLSNNSFATEESLGGHCAMCLDGGGSDWLYVTFLWMNRVDSISGRLVLSFAEYTTAKDPTCGDIIAKVTREGCTYWTEPETVYDERPCLWLCGDSINCKGWGYCDWCGFWAHSFSTWTATYRLYGKGTFEVTYKNALQFYRAFNFGDFSETALPTFVSTEFKNKDYTSILRGDVFDAMESIALSVIAKFNGRPSPFIVVKFISDVSQDTTGAQLELSGRQGDFYVYSIILPPRFFGGIVGDPNRLPPGGATITAIPKAVKCDGTVDPNVPVGHVTVADYSLYVSEISFLDDFKLYKEDSITAPPRIILIRDPVWITNGNINDPAAYRRDSTYNMSIVVKCDHFPMHDFGFKIRAVCQGDQHIARYSTGEYEGHIAYSDHDTIANIRPAQNGQFPDYVGSDSLIFIWSANKSFQYGLQNYRRLNITGPHKIFFTYESPLIDTVKVRGLEKICTYAQGQNIDTVIAQYGVNGLYGEHWHYDPDSFVSKDPTLLLWRHIGQCGDYANLLVYFFESIGIRSHGVVIFNAAQTPDSIYSLLWWDTLGHGVVVLTDSLEACDGQAKYWPFTYHAVAELNDHFCDAALGLFRPDSDYAAWWKYYVYPQDMLYNYLDNEPPPVHPFYYHHDLYVLPSVYPHNRSRNYFDTLHTHHEHH